ncbi:SCO family protein [Piscinibacter sp.]|jgi:protein SCO1/2|uniref:SCO family protein n=1 Tax=Piscinibacter sp. TaxID=1903157 RepID=UPI003559BA8F
MRRTSFACLALVLLAYAAAHWLTRDFQVWTAEGARRLEVALHPVPAPRIAMDGPGLQGQTLQQVLLDEHAVTIVDFMYTRCITVCVALGSAFQQMQTAIAQGGQAPGAAPLRLMSISFDPAHDEPAVLARFAESLHADSRVWSFARVAHAADAQPLLAYYQVTVIADGMGGYEHNAALLVVDTDGRLVRVFEYAELVAALDYARFLAGRRAPP